MPWMLYYDGGCNICHKSKIRMEKWAERRGVPLEALPLQTNPQLVQTYGDNLVLKADGQTFVGGDAWMKAFELAPFPLRVLRFCARTSVTRALIRIIYRVVARLRYIFGRRQCNIGSPR